jgi:hypothetical protein
MPLGTYQRPSVPKALQKIYLVGPSGIVLRHGTWFWTVFGSIWTQVGPKF